MTIEQYIVLVVTIVPILGNLSSLAFRLFGWHGAAEKLDQMTPIALKLGETFTKVKRSDEVLGVLEKVAKGETTPADGARILTGAPPASGSEPSVKLPPMPPLGVMLFALALAGCNLTPAQTAALGKYVPPIAGATCHLVAELADNDMLRYACTKAAEGGLVPQSTGGVETVPLDREKVFEVPREHRAEFEAANRIEP